jgi:hypothetical protein
MKKQITKICGLAAILLAMTPALTTASTVVNNLSQPVGGFETSFHDADVGTFEWYAQSFSTGEIAYHLDSITAPLGNATGGAGLQIVAQLRLGAGSVPAATGVPLVFSSPLSTTGMENVVLTPSTPITLDANQTYWLVFGANAAPGATGVVGYDWNFAQSPLWTGEGTLGGWSVYDETSLGWTSPEGTAPQMLGVLATAIPEPQSIYLLVMGLGLVAGVRRQANRR